MVGNLTEEVIIESMTGEDIGRVADLLIELQSHLGSIDNFHEITVGRWLKTEFMRMLEWRMAFVARYKGEIVGTAVLQITPEDNFLDGFVKHKGSLGEIEYLVVTRKYRGCGIGRKLIEASEKYFKDTGCVKIEISYLETNKPAMDVYTKLGFKPSIRTSAKMIPENF